MSATEDRTEVLGRRIGAALLDVVLLFVIFLFVALTVGDTQAEDGSATATLDGVGALVFSLIGLLYYGLSEAMSGQTLGKRLMKVRVVRLDGSAPSTGAIVARTLLRIVDSLPFAYLLGLIVVLATGAKRQRIGDLAAGTTVIAVDTAAAERRY